MATFSKIPLSVKKEGCIAIVQFAIFCKGLLKAADVMDRLVKADKRGGLPAYGYITYKGEKIYYCRYGFVDDPATYDTKR